MLANCKGTLLLTGAYLLTKVASSAMLCITHHSTAPTTAYAKRRPAGPAFAYAEPVPTKRPVPMPLQKPIMEMW